MERVLRSVQSRLPGRPDIVYSRKGCLPGMVKVWCGPVIRGKRVEVRIMVSRKALLGNPQFETAAVNALLEKFHEAEGELKT